ncbi:cell wall synthase accessory phosphoprotein MacP [Streptococcaceae bacterium ESL0687]|nr:cell wall synthase accessory phosphoprotein MacP [Streptococcaceae bacterium ESL0687]
MPKPILTDEIIREYKDKEKRLDHQIKEEMKDDTKLIRKYDKLERDLQKKQVHKSRRIENAKRSERNKNINKWILILIILISLLAFAVFKL